MLFRSAHQLEKAQAGPAVFFPFKVCILLGQNGMPGISDANIEGYRAIREDVYKRQPLQWSHPGSLRLLSGRLLRGAAGGTTSTGSNNTQQPAGNDSKPAASNQTVAPEPAQSEPAQPEAPKNEYVARLHLVIP